MPPDTLPSLGGLAPYAAIVLYAALPTHVWRWLGVALAGRLDERSEVLAWVRAVATAMVAALIARLVLFPSGALAEVAVLYRVAAAGAGFAVYLASGKRLLLGILVAEAGLLLAFLVTVG